MLRTAEAEIARFVADDSGAIESDWVIVVVTLGGALGLSSFFGYNIGQTMAEAFDDMIMSALRRAGA